MSILVSQAQLACLKCRCAIIQFNKLLNPCLLKMYPHQYKDIFSTFDDKTDYTIFLSFTLILLREALSQVLIMVAHGMAQASSQSNSLQLGVLVWRKKGLPAGKGRLFLTHHAQESIPTWWGSSGFSPTVEPATKDNRKERYHSSFLKKSIRFHTLSFQHITLSSFTFKVISLWLVAAASHMKSKGFKTFAFLGRIIMLSLHFFVSTSQG